jgi:hypothetical protein
MLGKLKNCILRCWGFSPARAMKTKTKVQSPMSIPSRAAVRAASFAGTSLLLTVITMTVYRVWSGGIYTFLILVPYLIAFGWLGALFAMGASTRAHLSLASTTTVLAIVTFLTYVFALVNGPGGCMSSLIFFVCVPFSIGFPIVFLLSWWLYGPTRNP